MALWSIRMRGPPLKREGQTAGQKTSERRIVLKYISVRILRTVNLKQGAICFEQSLSGAAIEV